MASLLLQCSVMVSDGITSSFAMIFLNQKTSSVALEAVIYLTFMVEYAMIDYLELFQLTAPSLHKKIYPNVDFLSSTSVIKSELVYPFIFSSDPPPKIKHKSLVLLK